MCVLRSSRTWHTKVPEVSSEHDKLVRLKSPCSCPVSLPSPCSAFDVLLYESTMSWLDHIVPAVWSKCFVLDWRFCQHRKHVKRATWGE